VSSLSAPGQGGAWDFSKTNLTIGSGTASRNTLIVNNATLTNIAALAVSGTAFGNSSLTVSNGGKIFASSMPGSASGAKYNIGGLGDASFVSIGTGANAQFASGGSGVIVNITNATLALNIGGAQNYWGISGGASNVLNVFKDGYLILSNPGGVLNIGNSFGGTRSNALIVSGGVVTNHGMITVGGGGQSNPNFGNSIMLSNGASWFGTNGHIQIGGGGGGNSNMSFNVGGLGAAVVYSNSGTILVGGAGARNITMTITNADMWSGSATIGSGGSNNTITVNAGGTWNLLGGNLGFGNGTGNALIVNSGGVVTNVGGLNLAGRNLTYSLTNNILMSAGVNVMTAQVYFVNSPVGTVGALNIGSTAGLGGNSLSLSNQLYTSVAVSTIGSDSSNNTVTILNGAAWNSSNPLRTNVLGSGAATGNWIRVDAGGIISNGSFLVGSGTGAKRNTIYVENGGVMTNVNITVGGDNAQSNQLLVTGGGKVFANNLRVGVQGSGANNISNLVLVSGDGSRITANLLVLGQPGGAGGRNVFDQSLIVSNGAALITGTATILSHNQTLISHGILATVTGNGSVWTNTGNLTVAGGGGTMSNIFLTVDNNAVLVNQGVMNIGSGSSTNAVVSVLSGGTIISSNVTVDGRFSTLRVSGPNSLWTNTGTLSMGLNTATDDSYVIITNQGRMFTGDAHIGDRQGQAGNQGSKHVIVTDTNSLWSAKTVNIGMGRGAPGGSVTNNSVSVLNGATLLTTEMNIGNANTAGSGTGGAYSNRLTIIGPGTTWTNTGNARVGYGPGSGDAAVNNQLLISNQATAWVGGTLSVGGGGGSVVRSNRLIVADNSVLAAGHLMISDFAGASSNTLLINDSRLIVTNSSGTASLVVGRLGQGTLTVNNSSLLVDQLVVTNNATTTALGTINRFTFNSGVVTARQMIVNNSAEFVIGNGAAAAQLALIDNTTHRFANGLVVTNNATFTAVGTMITGTSGLSIKNGGTFSPGNSPGLLTVGNATWAGGGTYLWEIDDLLGTAGVNWDLLAVTNALTITATSGDKFNIVMDTMGALAANFDATEDYTLAIASFNSITGFDPAAFAVDSSAFANAPGSQWTVTQSGNYLLLGYGGFTNEAQFVWGYATGNFSVGGNWTNGSAPYGSVPAAELKLQFGTNTATAFTASNNGVVGSLNAVLLNSAAGSASVIDGSGFTFIGSNAVVVQLNAGGFIFSNTVTLATNLIFRGTGGGSVVLASNITGSGQIIKRGAWNLELQGSNTWTGGLLVDAFGGTLTLSHSSAAGTNSVVVSNGTVIAKAAGGHVVGSGADNTTVLITGINSTWSNNTLFTVGANGGDSNVVTVEQGGRLVTAGGAVVGGATSSNTVMLVGNSLANRTIWDGGATNLLIGEGRATGNVVRIDGNGVSGGALVTNIGAVRVGGSAALVGSFGNTLILTNGGELVRGPGTADSYIGDNGAGNLVTIVGGTSAGVTSVWNNGGAKAFIIGNNGGSNNTLVINGNGFSGRALLTNLTSTAGSGALTVGNTSSGGNTMIITNGGALFVDGTGGVFIGRGSSNNTALVMGGGGSAVSLWNNGNRLLLISTNGTNNRLVINGGGVAGGAVVTNVGNLLFGALLPTIANHNNSVLLTNGGRMFVNGLVSLIGVSNTVTVVGGAASSRFFGNPNNQINVGQAANTTTQSHNRIVIGSGGVMTNVGFHTTIPEIDFIVGWAQGAGGIAFSNQLVVDGGRLDTLRSLAVGFIYGNISAGGIASSNSVLIANGGIVNVPSNFWIGSDSTVAPQPGIANFNSLTITNGGQLTTQDGFIGRARIANSTANVNRVTISASSLWNLSGRTGYVGHATSGVATGNTLTIGSGGVVSNLNLVVGWGRARSNEVILSGGSLLASSLIVSNAGNRVIFNSGTLSTASTVYSNGTDFVVGNGTQAATLQLTGSGTHRFQNNLVITNHGTLTGTGNILVNNGGGQTWINSGAVLSPGSSPGVLTNTGTLVWNGGGSYLWEINDFSGGIGLNPGWDLVHVIGVLSNAATSGNQFNINLTTLNGNVAGNAANFNPDATYTLTIATATVNVASFDSAAFQLNFGAFSNAWDGTWRILLNGNAVQLTYTGQVGFVWDNVHGNFSNLTGTAGIHWLGDEPPPLATTNLVMYFGGVGSQQYTATNNLTGLVSKRIVLTNQSSATQSIVGNSITLAGVAPEIRQNESGGFVMSNTLALANNTTLSGSGSGTLELAGAISGAYNLTKTGGYNAVLSGANSYSGSTLVNGGTLTVRNDAALSGSTQTVVNVLGTLVADGGAPVVRRLTGGGSVVLTNGAALTLNNTGAGSTYAGVISGDGSVTKSGSSTLTLSGVSTYSGDTRVNAGTLTVSGSLASTNLLVSAGTFNWASVTALTNVVAVTVNSGGTLNFQTSGTLGALTGGGLVTLDGVTAQVGFGGVSTNFAGRLSGTGTLVKGGAGTWSLTGGGGSLTTLVASNGTVAIAGAQLTNATLAVLSGGNVALQSGQLVVLTAAAISNGQDFVVGNGVGAATFTVSGSAHMERDLIVTNNGTLKGGGSVTVRGGAGTVYLQSGGVQAPGNSVGTQTVVGTNVWEGGGSYQWEVNDFTGTKGVSPGWDWLNVIGVLSNAATSGNPFVIDITSLNGSSAGLAANFDNDGSYSLIIATATTLADMETNRFALSTANFQNPYDGRFTLSVVDSTNLVLNYQGVDTYAWKDLSGNFSVNGNWVGGVAPPTGATNVVLYFGGSTLTPYTANNDLSGLIAKRVVLTNNTAVEQSWSGNAVTLAGVAPRVDQLGSGAYLWNNEVVLGTNVTVGGSGSGTLTLNGVVSGSGDLIKTGGWTLVLGGANTYSGATVVREGALFVAHSSALAGSTLSNLIPGAVVITNVTTVNLGGLAGSVDLGLTNTAGAGVALVVGGNNQSTTYDGALSGAGSLTKVGSGSLTLSGASSYTGGTVVNNGSLIVGALPNGIGGSGASLGTGSLTINGGTVRYGLVLTNSVAGLVVFNGGSLSAAMVINRGQMTSLGNTSRIVSDLYNEGTVTNSGGILLVNGGVTNSGTIALAGGTLTANVLTNTGTVVGYGTLSPSLVNRQLVSATNGQLNLQGYASGAGTYRAEAGATLSFNGGGTISSLFNTGGTIRVASLVTNTAVFQNAGTLALAGGTYQTSTKLTNALGATIRGFGTISSAAELVNDGTLLVTGGKLTLNSALQSGGHVTGSGGELVVNGVFTNSGSLNFVGTAGTFNGAVFHSGGWAQNATASSLFQSNVMVSASGTIAGSGGTYVFRGDLNNQSTANTTWNTLNVTPGTNTVGGGTKFLFDGTSLSSTQYFTHPGLLLTGGFVGSPVPATTGVQDVSSMAAVTGFQDNFAVGQFWLTNSTLVLAPTSGSGALFVNDLYLFGASQLVISNDMRVYFVNSNSWSLANITLLGNAEIHQLNSLTETLTVIPEPNVLVMWLAGVATFFAARRRKSPQR
jgi:autotransporter-associated beta strand protein